MPLKLRFVRLAYLPFGEEFVDQRTSDWNAMYKFSGKEKDQETGYNYFGARYYDSDISIFITPDPMSDKYPYQTPYSYCGNRPINVIDPNGEDEWEVNKRGYVRHVPGSEDKPDKLFAVGGTKKGEFGTRNDKTQSMDVDKDIMNSMRKGEYTIIDKETNKPKKFDHTKFNVSGKDGKAQEMMTFLSKNVDAEFGYWGTVDGYGTESSMISTNHDKDQEHYAANMSVGASKNNGLRFYIHTQPKDIIGSSSSSADRNTRDQCTPGSPNAVFGILNEGRLYDYKGFRMGWDGVRR